jgi:hypothetical protein
VSHKIPEKILLSSDMLHFVSLLQCILSLSRDCGDLFQNKDAKSTSSVLETELPRHLFVPIRVFEPYNSVNQIIMYERNFYFLYI